MPSKKRKAYNSSDEDQGNESDESEPPFSQTMPSKKRKAYNSSDEDQGNESDESEPPFSQTMSPRKRKAYNSSDDDQGNESDESSEATFNQTNNVTINNGDEDLIIGPNPMRKLIKLFEVYLKEKKREGILAKYMKVPTETELRKNTSKPHIIIQDFYESLSDEEKSEIEVPTTKMFIESFKKYLIFSSKAMTLKSASSCILDYLDSEDALKRFPDFPKAPPNLLNYYLKTKNIKTEFGKRHAGKDAMNKDDSGRAKAKKELVLEEQKYLGELRMFQRQYASEITNCQREWLRNKICVIQRKIEAQTNPKTPQRVKPPRTSFDYYMKSMESKFLNLDKEAREKKLMKRFEKLDPGVREIFDNLALNMPKKK